MPLALPRPLYPPDSQPHLVFFRPQQNITEGVLTPEVKVELMLGSVSEVEDYLDACFYELHDWLNTQAEGDMGRVRWKAGLVAYVAVV